MNIDRKLNQVCTYWVKTSADMFNKGVFSAPVQLACRWEDLSELFIDKNGREVTCKSRVFFSIDISLQGYLFLGTSAALDPTLVVGAFEVMQIKRTPNLRANQTLYVAML